MSNVKAINLNGNIFNTGTINPHSLNVILKTHDRCNSFGIMSLSNEISMRIQSTVKDIIQEIEAKLKDHERELIIGYNKFQSHIEETVEIVVKKVFSGMYIGQFVINVDFERCDDCHKMVIYDQNEIIKLTIELKG